MAFNLDSLNKALLKKQKEIYNLQYIEYKSEIVHPGLFEEKNITPSMYKQMSMNSYGSDPIAPKLTNKTLIESSQLFHLLNTDSIDMEEREEFLEESRVSQFSYFNEEDKEIIEKSFKIISDILVEDVSK